MMMSVGRLRSQGVSDSHCNYTARKRERGERGESHYDSTLCVNVVDDVLRLAGFIVCVCVRVLLCASAAAAVAV